MGKGSAPAPPDYSPFIGASQAQAAADAQAAQLQYSLGQDQLAAEKTYADKSAQLGDEYFQMAQQAQQWGKDQFNQVWPYAQQYLQQQNQEGVLAGQYAQAETKIAQQQADEANQTYQRYMTDFVPEENKLRQLADDYLTPARADQNAAAAQADVATSFDTQKQAADNELRSYGIDPSQGRFAGSSAILQAQRAAAMAAASTESRRATEQTGIGLTQAAIAVGQKLPAQSISQITAGTQAGASGITAGQAGGGAIGAASGALTAGVNATGSPTSYAYLSNPYTSLAGTSGSLGSNLFSGGNYANNSAGTAIAGGASILNTSFQNQLDSYKAQTAAESSFWGGAGGILGGVGRLATAPLGGTALGAAFGIPA